MTVLATRDLSIGYGGTRQAVAVARDLTLTLAAGQMTCLLGPNGAGKSTLMRTLAGMQPPLSGQVLLNGRDITTLKPRDLAKRLSVVLTERPNVGLLNGYALVALGRHPYTDWLGRLSRYDEAVVRWAVDIVGASAFAERPVMALSDGQRQKLMIARALAQESDVILLDEPTAFLDLPRRVEIMHLLRRLAAQTGRAILLSTHDLDLALRTADTLWLLAAGRVHVGAPEDLVLEGAFEAAFHEEGVLFDRASGAFSLQQGEGSAVIVRGHGVPYLWTQRALKRAGFRLMTTERANGHAYALPQVSVSGEADNPVWHLCWNGRETTHHTIRDLLAALESCEDALKPNEEILYER